MELYPRPCRLSSRVSVCSMGSCAFRISYGSPLLDFLKKNWTLAPKSALSLLLGVLAKSFLAIMPYFCPPPHLYHGLNITFDPSFPPECLYFSYRNHGQASALGWFCVSEAQWASSHLDVTWQLSAEGRRGREGGQRKRMLSFVETH